MAFIAVMAWDTDGRVSKYAEYPTLAGAQAHVVQFAAQYWQAFAAAKPGNSWFDWEVSPSGNALRVTPRPRPPVVEDRRTLAIRRIADELSPSARAEITAILG